MPETSDTNQPHIAALTAAGFLDDTRFLDDTPTATGIPKFGDRLPNGAIVVDYRPITPTFGIVVAHRDHPRMPWCVWTMHPERWDTTESGSYLESLYDAGFEMDRRHGVYSR